MYVFVFFRTPSMSTIVYWKLHFSYESTSVEDLFQLVLEEVQHQKAKIDSLAFLLSGSEKVKKAHSFIFTVV